MKIKCPTADFNVRGFKQCFTNQRYVNDASGIITNTTINNGAYPLGANSYIVYTQTNDFLLGSPTMSIVMRYTVGAYSNSSSKHILFKAPSALNNNQFFLQWNSSRNLALYVAASSGDFANFVRIATINPGTYHIAVVYNGGLAAASRVAFYINGVAVGTTVTGTIPTKMLSSASNVPITIFNGFGGSTQAPDTDDALLGLEIYKDALSADDILKLYQNNLINDIIP